ncbi:MAG TPA: DUF1127 domain-containing protein [Stellaceae bacterium]|jgi:uncharacterized protein YjiS (DUF1127 family)|nr:DUF1127 domain-containing protein [Stellaceae bacterium]
MLNSIGNLLHRTADAMARRRELRRAYAELSALDDRSLADIGISRSEIAYALTHSTRAHTPATSATPVAAELRHAA